MAFPAEILQAGISIADSLTKGAQSSITLRQASGSGPSGDLTYDDPIQLKAVVDYTSKVTIRNAEIIHISATVTILEPVPVNGAILDPPRTEPIDTRDKITLPDGSTGLVKSVPGSVNNPNTGTGFIQVIEIGPRG